MILLQIFNPFFVLGFVSKFTADSLIYGSEAAEEFVDKIFS